MNFFWDWSLFTAYNFCKRQKIGRTITSVNQKSKVMFFTMKMQNSSVKCIVQWKMNKPLCDVLKIWRMSFIILDQYIFFHFLVFKVQMLNQIYLQSYKVSHQEETGYAVGCWHCSYWDNKIVSTVTQVWQLYLKSKKFLKNIFVASCNTHYIYFSCH